MSALDPNAFPLDDVTIPAGDNQTAHRILSSALRRAMKELLTLPVADLEPAVARQYGELRNRLRKLASKSPGALASLVRRANVGTFVRCLRSAEDTRINRDEIMATLVATAYAELAPAGALEEAAALSHFPKRIISLGRRALLDIPEGTTKLVFETDGRVKATTPDGESTLEFTQADEDGPLLAPIRPGIVLARIDDNPLSSFEAHPDKDGNAIELGERPLSEWTDSLGAALDLIAEFLPELRAEMDLVVQQVVPVGYDEHAHLSASFHEALGTIYCSLHPNPMTMAEALIHEFCHNKLNALFELDQLIFNAFSPLYASPVRPDPRPLHGILLAVHAFQPVARLYERMTQAGHEWTDQRDYVRRWRNIMEGNHAGAEVLLENARTTPAGSRLLAEIRRWDEYYGDVLAGQPAN